MSNSNDMDAKPDDSNGRERLQTFVDFTEISESKALSETKIKLENEEEYQDSPPSSPKDKRPVTEEDIIRLNDERWPHVNGVYDAEGEWHDWNDITFSYSYENSELIILPYTVCVVSLPGQQFVAEPPTTAASN